MTKTNLRNRRNVGALHFLAGGHQGRRTYDEIISAGQAEGVRSLVDRGFARWVMSRASREDGPARKRSAFLTALGQAEAAS
jgi:hypothetical protein